jgi:Tfp pilus assembly protein PilN
VRPVNLLPVEHGARAGGDGKSAYFVLGALGLLLLMVVGYVLTGNSVNARKGDIQQVRGEIARDQQKIGSQSAFGNFHDVKETRLSSISQVADDRFDWERLMRELSLVLPSGAALTQIDASKGPQAAGATTSSSPSSSSTTASDPTKPSLHLVGCAKGQPTVAVMLVRLRKLHGAEDVALAESSEQTDESGAGAAPGAATPDSAGTGSDGCRNGAFKFDVTVTFAELPPAGAKPVPARLGGGS